MTTGWLESIELHVVGGGGRSLPRSGDRVTGPSEHLLDAARRRGLRTLVVTRDPGFYDASDLQIDEWLVVDSSSSAAVLAALRSRAVDVRGVTSAVDNFVGVAARVAEALGLPGPDPRSPAVGRDKAAVRRALSEGGVEHVAHQVVEASSTVVPPLREAGLRYPFVAKPVDGAASWDVALVHDEDGLLDLMGRHLARDYGRGVRPRRRFVLEEHLEGPVFSVEGFVADGRLEVFGFSDRVLGTAPSFVELGASFAVDAPVAGAAEHVERILDALDYTWGPFHVELVATAQGLRLIEVNARFMGAGMQHAVSVTSARPWASYLLGLVLGEAERPGSIAARGELEGRSARALCELKFTAPAPGRLVGMGGLGVAPAAGSLLACGSYLPIGARVEPGAVDNSDRIGYVITSGACRAEAKRAGLDVLAGLSLDLEDRDGEVRSWPVGDEVRAALAAARDESLGAADADTP
jgi:hypothetical protein